MKRILLIAALALALVLCFSVTAMAEDINPAQDTNGMVMQGDLAKGETVSYDMTILSGTLEYEFTCTGGKAGILIVDKETGTSLIYDTFVKEGETKTKARELEAGTYTVVIRNDSTNTAHPDASYSYSIRFTSAGETYSMPNDTIPTSSGPIKFDREIVGHFAINDRQDIYRFDLEKSGRVTFKVTGMNETRLTLMKGTGESIPKYPTGLGDKSNETVSYDLLPGIYYAQFGQFSGEGIYNLTVSFKDAKETYVDEAASGQPVNGSKAIILNKKVKGQLAENDPDDLYTVYIPKAGDYNVTVTVDQKYKAMVWPFTVDSMYKSAKYDTRAEYYNQDSELTRTFIYRGLKKGKYYIKLADATATGPYSFVVKPAPVYNYKPVAGKKQLTAKWVKGTGSGYEVWVSLSKKFTKKTRAYVTKPSTVKKVFKNLKGGKRYYVKVRSYVTYNKKKYPSVWSDITYIKVKK